MTLTQLAPPYPIFTDKSGTPLDKGYLYFGTANLNPETNPIAVYYDSALTQPAAQPLRTSNGYVMRNGSPAIIYANSQFSVTVRDKNRAMVIYSPVGYGIIPGTSATSTDQMTYNEGETGAVSRVLTSRLQDYISVKDFGATGDGTTDDTAAIQAAFNAVGTNGTLYFPDGIYKTSSAITATCSFYGSGSGTTFKPSGGHEVFIVRAGRADRNYAERIGSFVIDFSHLGSITSADVGLWLSKGSASPATSGCNNVTFSNIFINRAYRGIQMLNTDLGNLWNVRFEGILIYGSSNYGIYIDTTGSNGSLNVSFDTVSMDGGAVATAKGAFIRGIPNMTFFGVSTALTGGSGSCLIVSDCSNVDVRVQIEGVVTNVAISGLVAFLNCPTVEVSLVSQTCTFNQGAGNDASYIYADANVGTLTVRALNNASDVYTSGTTYKLNIGFGVSSTKLCILDQNVVSTGAYASAAVIEATRWPDTNYALEKTKTTRRTQILDVSVAVGAPSNLVSVADYAARPYQVAGLYLVQGSWSNDATVGFTDLVLVTGVGQTTAQTAVAVSTNSINAGQARTYSISGGFLRVAVAHPSGTFIVSATGFDQAGSAN